MSFHKEIGGFFPLEINEGVEYYPDLLALNSGRNAFEYILLERKYKKVYIPYFTCEVLLEPLLKHCIEYEFYHINSQLEIENIPEVSVNEVILYTNYFGLKTDYLKELISKVENIIVDNAQAFFSKPFIEVDTFYSPRKFFGIPDGAYVSLKKYETRSVKFERDLSWKRFEHLLIRIDEGAEAGYEAFKCNDQGLSHNPIKSMSNLTRVLLKSIDYHTARKQRNANFAFLHEKLKHLNELKWLDSAKVNGPLIYPFCVIKPGLKDKLIENKIYAPTYWPNVLNWVSEDSIEFYLAKNLIPLPIDQRYSENDCDKIVRVIQNILY